MINKIMSIITNIMMMNIKIALRMMIWKNFIIRRNIWNNKKYLKNQAIMIIKYHVKNAIN